jgi:hypothetical protein
MSLKHTEERNLASVRTRTRPLGRRARKQWLYRLSYPGSLKILRLPKQFTRCLLMNSTEKSEKLIIAHPVNKFLTFYGTRWSLAMSRRDRNDACVRHLFPCVHRYVGLEEV